jgi:hypothetical protein
VGPRAGLDTEVTGKILSPPPGIEPRSPGRPARSQTLYCLSYLALVRSLLADKIRIIGMNKARNPFHSRLLTESQILTLIVTYEMSKRASVTPKPYCLKVLIR